MSTTQAAALAFLMGQHSAEEAARDASREPDVKVTVSMVPIAPVKPIKGSFNAKDPTHQKHQIAKGPKASDLPAAGSLGPRGFLKAVRDSRTQQERVFAIAAFVGFDPTRDFGSQLMAAEMRAKRELDGKPIPGPSREEKRAAARSLSGFVAGMPDATQKKIADLMARETASAEALSMHENDAADKSRSTAERTLSMGWADVERERLREIREDLKRFGV